MNVTDPNSDEPLSPQTACKTAIETPIKIFSSVRTKIYGNSKPSRSKTPIPKPSHLPTSINSESTLSLYPKLLREINKVPLKTPFPTCFTVLLFSIFPILILFVVKTQNYNPKLLTNLSQVLELN